jgi:hypothetical protein
MTTKLKQILTICDTIISNCDIDFELLQGTIIDGNFFQDYNNTRVVNSFLFNFSKLQDKIGSKLFKQLLFELKEIDTFSIVMIDVLNTLERLNILEKKQWDEIRETRNLLAHEYPFSTDERVENIQLSLEQYIKLKQIYMRVKNATKQL